MKLNFKGLLPFCLCLLVILTGCSSDDDTCSLNQSSLAGTYKITGAEYKDPGDESWQNDLPNWDACELDDTFTFSENSNILTLVDAGVQCNPTTSETGTYSLNGNQITITGGGNSETYIISEFSCNQFVIEQQGLPAGSHFRLKYTRI